MFIYNSMLAISIICFQLNLISYFSFKIIFRENSYNKKSWNILCKVTLELNFFIYNNSGSEDWSWFNSKIVYL